MPTPRSGRLSVARRLAPHYARRIVSAIVAIGWMLLGVALLVASLLVSMLRCGARVREAAVWFDVGLGVVEASFAWPDRVLSVRVLRLRVVRRRLSASVRRTDGTDAVAVRSARGRGGRSTPAARSLPDLRTLRAFGAVAADAVRRVGVDACEGHVRIATPDPALTGIAYGLAEGMRTTLPERHRDRLTFEPDFVSDLPGGRATVALRVRVAVLALAAWRVFRIERGRSRRRRRVAAAPGRSGHATHGTARGARGTGA